MEVLTALAGANELFEQLADYHRGPRRQAGDAGWGGVPDDGYFLSHIASILTSVRADRHLETRAHMRSGAERTTAMTIIVEKMQLVTQSLEILDLTRLPGEQHPGRRLIAYAALPNSRTSCFRRMW